MTFWDKLFSEKKMVLGLSPMDGVTDVAMRYMTTKYSNPDVLFTEFVSIDALHYATEERRERLLKIFMRARDVHALERGSDTAAAPRRSSYEIAQVFGHTPELFAEAAELVESLGFDGIDINMGCPMHKVEDQGSGAGLIRTPKLAQEIIKTVMAHTKLPVSVKTRIGVDRDVSEEWMEVLCEVHPANISLHGRTLRQLYQGSADWEAIGRAAMVVHKHGGHILGNGDIDSVASAKLKVESYGVDGVLIGRGAEGNPGVFKTNREPSKEQRLEWMVEHAKFFEQIFGQCHSDTMTQSRAFMPMRKHLAWYCKGFEGAVEMRTKLMLTNNADEVRKIVEEII
jgi:nifR3 family TIM-barrel protein